MCSSDSAKPIVEKSSRANYEHRQPWVAVCGHYEKGDACRNGESAQELIKQIRSAGGSVRAKVAESIKAPVDLLSDIMRRLELNGKKFEVETACSDDELESFWEILLQIESSLSSYDTTQDKVRDKASLQEFISHCCQVRHYAFCIKKCGKEECKVCKPVRMENESFEKLRFLPDPQIQDDGHIPFAKAFTLNTTVQDRPSLRERKQQSLCPSVRVYSMLRILIQWFSVTSALCGVLFLPSGNCQFQRVILCR